MSKHTPGPWMVSELNGRDVGPVRAFGFEGTDVRQLQSVALVRERAESDANARLIAAAPELLAALKDAVQTARNYYALFHDETWKERLTKWDAAIAKADGR